MIDQVKQPNKNKDVCLHCFLRFCEETGNYTYSMPKEIVICPVTLYDKTFYHNKIVPMKCPYYMDHFSGVAEVTMEEYKQAMHGYKE